MKAVLKCNPYMIQKISFLKAKSTHQWVFWNFFAICLILIKERLVYELQFLIDLIFFTCLNIEISNMSVKRNIDQNNLPYLSVQANWRSNRGNVQLLMRRLKENNRKENNGKFIFLTTTISILVISGIIISFWNLFHY